MADVKRPTTARQKTSPSAEHMRGMMEAIVVKGDAISDDLVGMRLRAAKPHTVLEEVLEKMTTPNRLRASA